MAKTGLDLDSVPEQVLYDWGCGKLVDNVFTINYAGVLFFARQPEKFLRENHITCVRYQGDSMAAALDRKDLYGDLLSLVDEAEAFVKRNTRQAFKVDGFKRVDIDEYPYPAIREAIINAVCHRDYSLGNNIFVNVFDGHVEVISPGNIPNNLTLKEVEGKSVPRNQIITGLFHKAGYIEKAGSGLKRMTEEMVRHGLSIPKYNITKAYFQITFNGPRDKILKLVKPSNETDLRELGLNERQVKVLSFLQEHKLITSREYAKKFEVNGRSARRDLSKLIKIGYLKTVGKSTSLQYCLPEALPSLTGSKQKCP